MIWVMLIIGIAIGWWIGFYTHAYLSREDKDETRKT